MDLDCCLQCGKPLVDGRAYCSDDCESLDATSPSISTTSSAISSPHFPPNHALTPLVENEIPSLTLSDPPLHPHSTRYRRMNSSHHLTFASDLEEDHEHTHKYHPTHNHFQDVLAYQESGEKPLPTSISPFLTPVAPSSLSYTRRPSSTNHHSTVPLLHRRSSSGASSPARSVGVPQSAPSPIALVPYTGSSTDDDFSDSADKDATMRAPKDSIGTPPSNSFKKRNRASLPAYFSLLQLSSTNPSTAKSSPKKNSSGPRPSESASATPHHRDCSLPITAPSTSAVTTTTVLAGTVSPSSARGRERGRSKRRGEGSSSSSANRSRSRSRRDTFRDSLTSLSKSPCQHRHLTRESRRVNSLEKVSDWVSSHGSGSKRKIWPPTTQPSSMADSGSWETEYDENSAPYTPPEPERRGRRRVHELDQAPMEPRAAPGFGNGRSGIRDRERRAIVLQ